MSKAAQTLMNLAFVALLFIAAPATSAVTLEELRNDPKLTPQKFASYFSEFEFKFRAEVQTPEAFLATRSGDCDDFATLASMILTEKGYTTKLISVRMPGETHVVCYVAETKSYLDYNNRGCLFRTVSAKNDLNEIARKVAKSFDAPFTSVAEFTFENGMKHLVNTKVAQGVKEPVMIQIASVTAAPIRVDF